VILLAGGTGHLGTRLVPLLIARGFPVRVLTRDPQKARRALPDVELRRGDVRDPASLGAAMEGVDTVISAVTGFGPRGAGPRAVDHEGNRALIRAAEAAGVGRYVLLSMHGAAPDHPLELLRMKHRAEGLLRQSRLVGTIIRPMVFMELWLGIVCGQIRTSGKATIFGRGANPINFLSVGDLACFVDRVVSSPELAGETFSVGGPENLTLTEMVEVYSAAVGRTAVVRHVPPVAMRAAALLLRPVRPDIAGLIAAGRQMDVGAMSFDGAALRRRFPEIPSTRLADIVRRESAAA
jgi:NADH dehydrogenase